MLSNIFVTTVVLASFVIYLFKRKPRGLPPGPPTGLLGDNRAQVPDVEPWKKFVEWSREYKSFPGPVISFYLGRTPNIVLNDAKSAYDLLDKKGEIYSSRPRNIMGQEILSGNMRGLGMQYGPRYRQWRKFQHMGMNGKAAHAYRLVQTLESSILLRDLVATSDNYAELIKRFCILFESTLLPLINSSRYATSVAFSVSYGSRIKSLTELVVLDNQRAQFAFGNVSPDYTLSGEELRITHSMPGRYIVESWPILLWLPERLQWFRWEQEKTRKLDIELYMRLILEVKRKMDEGRAKQCLSSNMLENIKNSEISLIQMAYNVSSSFSAGISTVTASFDVFLLAMLHYPQYMRKAQAEIDTVVGQSRMPSFEDEPSLPFLKALITEVMRWRPIAPTGVAHAVSEDDHYEGFFIPKGSIVYANIYAITKDPEIFPDPDTFLPERFLNPTHPRVADFDLSFGFGRRICPGQHVALQSMFIVISRLLWSFDILPSLDAQGVPILPDPDAFVGGLVSRPQPFKLRLVPRSPDVLKQIDAGAAEAEVELKAWE
ncbi:hypothetical protein M0805_009404 [Coniferiporia weirii]|nr:hypothetical protein M0805_009404 [Coniferiporia weirii]